TPAIGGRPHRSRAAWLRGTDLSLSWIELPAGLAGNCVIAGRSARKSPVPSLNEDKSLKPWCFYEKAAPPRGQIAGHRLQYLTPGAIARLFGGGSSDPAFTDFGVLQPIVPIDARAVRAGK